MPFVHPLQLILLSKELLQSKHFFDNIRNYNTQIKIKGQVYHLLKKENDNEKQLQIYFIDNTAEESNRRCEENLNYLLKKDIINLQNMLNLIAYSNFI